MLIESEKPQLKNLIKTNYILQLGFFLRKGLHILNGIRPKTKVLFRRIPIGSTCN